MTNPPTRNLLGVATVMLTPAKQVGPAPSAWDSFKNIMFASWSNVLLIFIPISWALNFATKDDDALSFAFSFLAIIPLAKLLAFATDELSIRVGRPLASLLNVTMGNTVELVIAILALVKCELRIVQSSLTGALLVNLLARLGMAFIVNGVRGRSQGSNPTARVQFKASLLIFGVITVLLPVSHILAGLSEGAADHTQHQGEDDLLSSRLIAIVLLFIYLFFVAFRLWPHAGQRNRASDGANKLRLHIRKTEDPSTTQLSKDHSRPDDVADSHASCSRIGTPDSNTSMTSTPNAVDPPSNGSRHDLENGGGDIQNLSEEVGETPQLSFGMSVALLVVATASIAPVGEWLVRSINGLTKRGHVSKEFVGLFVLQIRPVVELLTAAMMDNPPSSAGEAVESFVQIAFFVWPFIVSLGWLLGKPLTLLLDPYEALSLFLASLAVTYVMQDNKSNWLEGMLLICLYTVLGVTFWFYTGARDIAVLQLCT